MKINGTVKNLKDGSVEILCECRNDEHLRKFKKEIVLSGTDQYSAHVEEILVEDLPKRELGYFDVDYGGDVTNKDIATKIDIGSNVMRTMNSKIDSMNRNIETRFDTMGQKYDTIGKTLIKLEGHFIRLVEALIKEKNEKKK